MTTLTYRLLGDDQHGITGTLATLPVTYAPAGSAPADVLVLAGRVYDAETKHLGLVAIADELEALGIRRDHLLMHVLEIEGSDWYSPTLTAA